jgi:alpha-glucosidase (family GH31 glycosyl hydrolase)
VIGHPTLPPYDSFGWHQCRYGWANIQQVGQVVQNYSTYQIPLEYIWLDIDHMDRFQDFTMDPVNFAPNDVQSFARTVHGNNQKIVIILVSNLLA